MKELFQGSTGYRLARLQSWDYGNEGFYFVTICTANRECFFG